MLTEMVGTSIPSVRVEVGRDGEIAEYYTTPSVCPDCDSGDIEDDITEEGGDNTIFWYVCRECDFMWKEYYYKGKFLKWEEA